MPLAASSPNRIRRSALGAAFLSGGLTLLFGWIERKLSYFRA